MLDLDYEKLLVTMSFIKGQNYLDINCKVLLSDERTGLREEGGHLRAVVISSNWSQESFSVITDGIDVEANNCAKCLESNNIIEGTVGIILDSDFGGRYRAYESKAFVDLTALMNDVLLCDFIVTPLPISPELKKNLGFHYVNGTDYESYSIRYNNIGPTLISETNPLNDLPELIWPTTQILNRLHSVPFAESVPGLSAQAKRIVSLFKSNGNLAMTKSQIIHELDVAEDEISLAMMELLDYELLEETYLKEGEPSLENDRTICGMDFFQSIQNSDHEKVEALLRRTDLSVNDVGEDGRNALFMAIENKDMKMIEILLKSGADPNYEFEDGMTAIKLCWLTQYRAAESLLKEYGAKLDLW